MLPRRVVPIPTKRARTTSATIDELKTTCEMRIVHRLRGMPTSVKNTSAAIPNTISGVTRVIITRASSGVRSQGRRRGSARASIVPSTQATTALPAAIITELRSASVIASSWSASANHFVEKPSQTSTCRPPLKA